MLQLRTAHATLINIFNDFCTISGQICSKEKPKIFFSRNAPAHTQHTIADQVQMPIVTDLGKYLGMPLLTNSLLSDANYPFTKRYI